MKLTINLFLLGFSTLLGDVAVVCDPKSDGEEWQSPSSYPADGRGLIGWDLVNYHLIKRGEGLFLCHLHDSELPRLLDPSTSVIVVKDLPEWARPDWQEFLKKITAKKVLLCSESRAVMPEMYKKEVFKLFDVVLVSETGFVDNKKCFHYHYPFSSAPLENTPSFGERHLLAQISAIHKSRSSLLRTTTKYFKKHPEESFPSFKIPQKFKLDMMQKFRFCLCSMNPKAPSEATESLFNCFKVQTVPVLFGRLDEETIIPKNCYIQGNSFKSFKRLRTHLKKISERRYSRYLANAKRFLASPQGHKFTPEAFGQSILRSIYQAKLCHKKNYIIKTLDKKS